MFLWHCVYFCACVSMHLSILECVYVQVNFSLYICVKVFFLCMYIYINREREIYMRERLCLCFEMYVFVCIFLCFYMCLFLHTF